MQFFNWPVTLVTWVLALTTAVLLLGCAGVAWRAPILRQLGLRNIGRRRLRAVLIIGGLMLSTTVIGTAFGTGDTITYTLRSVITGSLGSVDEVVARSPRRVRLGQQVQALTEPGLGALAIANPDFFAQPESDRVIQALHNSSVIGGVAPVIITQVTVVHSSSQQLQSNVTLLAIAPDYPLAFGSLIGTDGKPVDLATLAQGQVVLNAAASDALDAAVGEPLDLLHNDAIWTVHIARVVKNGGLGGEEPLLLVPLVQYQRVSQHEGQVNQLLVANHGGADSVAHSAAATVELRKLLVDNTAAQQLHALLGRPDVQRDILVGEGIVDAPTRLQLDALRSAAAQPELTDRFISLISEPRLRQRLFGLGRMLPNASDRSTTFTALQNVATLSVLDIKQIALDQASEYGAVITTIFLVLGIFSIAAAILLIFLIFALLAADRGMELATMRALGMRRHQIMIMFLLEGVVYDLCGAVLGTFVSAGSSYLLVRALGQSLAPFGVQIEPHLAPSSLLLTASAGMLLTFVMMLAAAWRVSSTDLMAGVRGEGGSLSKPVLIGAGALLLLTALLVWSRWHAPLDEYSGRSALVLPTTLALIVAGLTCFSSGILRGRTFLGGRDLPGSLATLAGLANIIIWLRALGQLAGPRGGVNGAGVTIAIAGIILIIATVWTGIRSMGPVLLAIDYALTALPRLRAVVRPAAGYLGYQRWRAGLTVIMFGMIILTMVMSTTLIHVAIGTYVGSEPPVAGYDLRADVRGSSLGDLHTALGSARAVKASDFTATGSLATQEAEIIQLGLPRASWTSTSLIIVDDDFLTRIHTGMQRRLASYSSDAAVWTAVQKNPGTAVALDRNSNVINSDVPGATLPLWARPTTGGQPIKLTVLGIIDGRSELDAGIYVSRTTAAGLGITLPTSSSYFFAVQPGLRMQDVMHGLQLSFADQGLAVSDLEGTFRLISAFRLLLIRVIQGFLGLGLLAGIAALGLLGIQAVLERRQQLGMLRALGFTRGQTRATLACESTVVAAVGIAVGLGLGLILARSLVAVLSTQYGGLRFSVPWSEVGLTVALPVLGSSLSILLTAIQAGRVAPADALRVGAE
ncbi:MAG: ABC transporter permease [Herpetosiphonaceae bacterium]|nr:ABC transporter permease [Herpetosiphonaceae bacterium]